MYNDTWIIEGYKYTGALMRRIADTAIGKEIRIIKRENGFITFEELKQNEKDHLAKIPPIYTHRNEP